MCIIVPLQDKSIDLLESTSYPRGLTSISAGAHSSRIEVVDRLIIVDLGWRFLIKDEFTYTILYPHLGPLSLMNRQFNN